MATALKGYKLIVMDAQRFESAAQPGHLLDQVGGQGGQLRVGVKSQFKLGDAPRPVN